MPLKAADNRFAIDLLWLRSGQVGGSESFIRNLLDGMCGTDERFHVVLLATRDNAMSLRHYCDDPRFELIVCPLDAADVKKRILWQNIHLRQVLKEHRLEKCFEPVYSMPLLGTRGIDYYTVIHDLQAHHFPQNTGRLKYVWQHIVWRHAVRASKKVIAISSDTMDDIARTFPTSPDKLVRIYNPVSIGETDGGSDPTLLRRCGVRPQQYFLCVAALQPHKNLETLFRVMKQLDDDTYRLLIVGVGGVLKKQLILKLREMRLNDRIRILPFVNNAVRDALYRNCRIFLFPSIFEGFGMPPVEALLMDRPVITTKCASIPEATRGEAVYVNDPYDAAEWVKKIRETLQKPPVSDPAGRSISSRSNPYQKEKIAAQYLALLSGESV